MPKLTGFITILSRVFAYFDNLKSHKRCHASDEDYFEDVEHEENYMIDDNHPSVTVDEDAKFQDSKETGALYYKK